MARFVLGLRGTVLERPIRLAASSQGWATSAYDGVELLGRDYIAPVVVSEPGEEPKIKQSEMFSSRRQGEQAKIKTTITVSFLQRLQGPSGCLETLRRECFSDAVRATN